MQASSFRRAARGLRLLELLAASCLAAAPSLASETRFGLQGHLALPKGTFGDGGHLDHKLGWGLGFQVPVNFGNGHEFRPRLDYLAFRRNEGGIRYHADSLVLLGDYLFYFEEERREGAYILGGLGLHHTRLDVSRSLTTGTVTADRGTTGLAWNLGLGYLVTPNLAFEVKFLGLGMGKLPLRPAGADPSYMGNSIQASISYTF